MKISETPIPGVLIVEPAVFGDNRGFFKEIYHLDKYREVVGELSFVQDNFSCSSANVLRGLHAQFPNPQGKLVQVLKGSVYDIAVDIRKNSPTFGKCFGLELSAQNHKQLYIPPGLAHGLCTLEAETFLMYKCTDFYKHENEFTIRYDDPQLHISWPVTDPNVSEKDANGMFLRDLPDTKLMRMT
ncbi:MAG: dTDP-4-dehydrorhamnose 3,5-epimerase [Oligoflexales bacterium]|nr:dTDP-4-dehydrorhamnose 3,5-epimerase [Oligoflexales bacterium]